MSDSAKVTSIEAVQEFKANLSIFCEDALEALSMANMEVRHLVDRIQRDWASRWKKAVIDRQDELAQAKNELMRKQMQGFNSDFKPDIVQERKAVRKAQERLQEAEEKVENCRRWGQRDLPRALEDFSGPSRQLEAMVQGEPAQMVLHLGHILDTLDSYVGLATPFSAAPASMAQAPASTPPAAAGSAATPPAPSAEKPAPETQPAP